MAKVLAAAALALLVLCAPRPVLPASERSDESQKAVTERARNMTRACEQINLNANDMATCRTRYAAAKNDEERAEILKFFKTGGDQRASDPNSEGHAVSGKDTQHTPGGNPAERK